MMKVVKPVSIMALVLLLSGCGTIFGRTGIPSFYPNEFSSPQKGIYPGTQLDGKFLQSHFLLFALIDLPISLVTDTLLLPVDLYRMN
jgi:uncharacterized protein YceK